MVLCPNELQTNWYHQEEAGFQVKQTGRDSFKKYRG